jgi:ABC-type nitrate/sulfonate/bicarbonate transport system substrate-binding protein
VKRSRLGGYALACALVVSACSSTPGSSPAASSGGGGSSSAPAASSGGGTSFPAVLPLRFGTIPGANHLPNYLAIKNAAKYGLDIKDNQFTKPADNLTALITGQIDVADQTPSTAIVAQDQNLPVVMIAGDARGSTQIVISKNLGVAEGDWAGLQAAASKAAAAGKKLKFGASVGPSSNYIECYFELKLKGVDPATQLEVVNIPAFPDMAAALRAGSADMLCAPQPYATQAKTTGNGMLFAAYPVSVATSVAVPVAGSIR